MALRSVRDQTMVLWTDPVRQGWRSRQPVSSSKKFSLEQKKKTLFSAGSLDGSASASRGKDEDQVVPGRQGGESFIKCGDKLIKNISKSNKCKEGKEVSN